MVDCFGDFCYSGAVIPSVSLSSECEREVGLRALTIHHPSRLHCKGGRRISKLCLLLRVTPCYSVSVGIECCDVRPICGEGEEDVGCFVAFFWLEAC